MEAEERQRKKEAEEAKRLARQRMRREEAERHRKKKEAEEALKLEQERLEQAKEQNAEVDDWETLDM